MAVSAPYVVAKSVRDFSMSNMQILRTPYAFATARMSRPKGPQPLTTKSEHGHGMCRHGIKIR